MISVIVPMYNAEKYVSKCIDSLIAQTYKDLEIIIVNDGSIDNSKKICEKYIEKDKRIKLINTENRGAGSARNTGFEMSKGEYISFIDSDDYVCIDYYERLINMLEKTGSDIAIGKCKRVSQSEKMEFTNTEDITERTNLEELLILYGEDEDLYINSVLVTNKLFKKKLFGEDIRFPTNRLIDDEFIIYKLIYNSKKIVSTNDVMYAYVQSDSSVMRTNFKEKRVYDTMDVYDEVYNFFKTNGTEELNKLILIRYLSYCVEMAQKTSDSMLIENKERVYEYLKGKFKKKEKEAKENIEEQKYINFYESFYKVVDAK